MPRRPARWYALRLALVVALAGFAWQLRPRDQLLVAGYVAINAAILAMNVRDADPFWYIWVPFAFAGWWWVGRRA